MQEVLYETIFSRLSGFGDKQQWGGLEGTYLLFEFLL